MAVDRLANPGPVDVSLDELADELRLPEGAGHIDSEFRGILRRLKSVGECMVERYAPDAPVAIKEEAVIRMAGYLFDQPEAGGASKYASAWRGSGAYGLCAPWMDRGLGLD